MPMQFSFNSFQLALNRYLLQRRDFYCLNQANGTNFVRVMMIRSIFVWRASDVSRLLRCTTAAGDSLNLRWILHCQTGWWNCHNYRNFKQVGPLNEYFTCKMVEISSSFKNGVFRLKWLWLVGTLINGEPQHISTNWTIQTVFVHFSLVLHFNFDKFHYFIDDNYNDFRRTVSKCVNWIVWITQEIGRNVLKGKINCINWSSLIQWNVFFYFLHLPDAKFCLSHTKRTQHQSYTSNEIIFSSEKRLAFQILVEIRNFIIYFHIKNLSVINIT